MDLHLIQYEHPFHFPIFWSIFNDFWEGINGISLKGLVTVQLPDGSFKAISKIEDTLVDCLKRGWKAKFVYDTKAGKVLGFIQYEFFCNGVLFVHSAYVVPEQREKGIGGFIMKSFAKGTPCMFHVHKDTPPAELLSCISSMERVCDSLIDSKLDLWRGEVV